MLFFFHQPFCLHPDHIEGPHPVQLLRHGFLQSQQSALSQPAVQEGKDADKRILADKAFLNALVVKFMKCLIEKAVVKTAVVQRPFMGQPEGGLRIVLSDTLPPQSLISVPVVLFIGIVVASQHLHAVQSNGRPACLVMAFPVAGGKILDAAPEHRAQAVILQLVPDSAPG